MAVVDVAVVVVAQSTEVLSVLLWTPKTSAKQEDFK